MARKLSHEQPLGLSRTFYDHHNRNNLFVLLRITNSRVELVRRASLPILSVHKQRRTHTFASVHRHTHTHIASNCTAGTDTYCLRYDTLTRHYQSLIHFETCVNEVAALCVCVCVYCLPVQFICPHTNRRRDSYGGSIDNRLRYPLEVFEVSFSSVVC